jgi:hypothetical protein
MDGTRRKLTPHGHIEERLKTMRKFEGVRVKAPRVRLPVQSADVDIEGK